MTPVIRVLVVDDDPLVPGSIEMMLSTEPDIEVVGQAADGDEAVDLAKRLQPDIVLMDVRMPGTNGVQATELITADEFPREPDRTIQVIAMTMYNIHEDVYKALRAGASGFLLKHTISDELVRALRAVAAGDGWLTPAVTTKIIKQIRHDPERPPPAALDALTPREREVLVLVGHGLSNVQIARHLVIAEKTVKAHFGRIKVKLGLRDRAQATAAAFHTGLVRPGTAVPPPPDPQPHGERYL